MDIRNRINKLFRADEMGVVISLILIIAVTTVIRRDFLTIDNFRAMFTQITYIAVVALGTSIPLMVGNVDISGGRVAGLSGIMMASLIIDGWPAGVAIIFALLIALLVGMLNGFLVVYCNITDFIVTMGTLYIAGGARYLFMRGYLLSLNEIPGFTLTEVFQNRYFGMPIYFWITILLVILLTLMIKRTIFGRSLLIAGDSREVAQLAGIKVNRVRLIAYMLSAVFAGIAGIFLTLSIGLGLPETGDGWEFRAIAGAVVGGTSLAGGKSSPLGTFLGVTLMFVAENALIFVGLPATMRVAVQGILMAVAVFIDLQRQKRKTKA
jgi:ribose/xylose/arabinose/galactoside ABC-type transport system permease subunit